MSPPFASGPAQTETIWSAPLPRADVAESVDAPDLKSVGHRPWGFESPRPHHPFYLAHGLPFTGQLTICYSLSGQAAYSDIEPFLLG